MKVLYVVKSTLHFYPPCVSQIRFLNGLGVQTEVLYGSCAQNVIHILDNEGIPHKELCDKRGHFKGTLDKLYNWYSFRKALIKELKLRDLSNTIVWFGNAETLLPMKGSLKGIKYAVTFLELLDDHPLRMKLLKSMAQNALFNVSCEETRSYILKSWWSLNSLPYTMPNKPYDPPKKFETTNDPQAKALLQKIGNKKIVILQGFIKEFGILKNFAEAMNELNDDYVLLLMGPEAPEIIDPLMKISSKIVYSKYIPAPNHLQVTQQAYIGIVYYNGMESLNNAFCAPNKIYEYSAFGLPMLANNIPGLKNTVGARGAAICCDLTKNQIIAAIKDIEHNYESMKNAAIDFYKSTDCEEIMRTIINEKINNK